jgi:hypothetical protein
MSDYLTEYLVGLGFAVDDSGFSKLKNTMAFAEATVTQHTTGIAKRIAEFQFGVVGAYTAISASILGVVDKVAMQDQHFRLLGESLLMPMESARKMSLITETLGASMEQIIWDPELHTRAQVLGADIDRMTQSLGPGFEGNMKSVRDFRAELGRLGVGVEFLGMQFTQDLWTQLAPGAAGQSFHDWITEMEGRIPEFSRQLSGYAVPALRETWMMAKSLGGVLMTGATAFSNVTGVLTGDHSIEGTTFSFHKLAGAIGHVSDGLIATFDLITKSERVLANFALGTSEIFSGDYKAAANTFATAMKDLTPGSGAVLGGVAGAAAGPFVGGALGTAFGGPIGGLAGTAAGAIWGPLVGAGAGAAAGFGSEFGQKLAPLVDSGEARKSLVDQLGIGAGGLLADVLEKSRMPDYSSDTPSVDFTSVTRSLDIMQRWQSMIDESNRTGTPLPASPFVDMPVAPTYAPLPNPVLPALSSLALMMPPPQPVAGLDKLAATMAKADPVGEFNSRLAQAIATYEKVNPTYNNPGAITEHGALAKYPDFTTGWQKLLNLIGVYEQRGVNLEQFFARYAPKDDHKTPLLRGNDPEAYAAFVAGKLGIDVHTPLNQILDQMQKAAPVIPVTPPPPTLPPISFQLPWMSPAAADSMRAMPASYQLPFAAAPHQRDWSSVMNVSIAPMPSVVSNSRTYGPTTVTVHITEPGADVDQIKKAVLEAVREEQAFDIQVEIAQLTAAYG